MESAASRSAWRGSWVWVAPLVLLGAAYLLLKAFVNLDPYDEGIRLYGAMRIRAGGVPYHDFFAYYGPAQFYWPAAWFAVLGEQLWVARASELVGALGALVAVVVLLCRAGAGWLATCWATACVLLPLTEVHLNTLDPALSLSLWAAVVVGDGSRLRRLCAAGVLIGLAGLFRHDFGLYGAVAIATLLAASAISNESLANPWPAIVRRISVVAAAACLVAAPAYGALAIRDPKALWDSLIVAPPRLMSYRLVPYSHAYREALLALRNPSATRWIHLWVMLAPVLAGLLSCCLVWRRGRSELLADPRRVSAVAFLSAFAAGLMVYASGRTDVFHVYPLHVVVGALCALVAGSMSQAGAALLTSPRLTKVLGYLVSACIIIGFIDRLQPYRRYEPASLERASGIRIADDERWFVQAVRDASAYAHGRPIYLGAGRHDRVIANLMTAYFLLGQEAPTFYQDVLPGLTTSADVQRRMIADLEASGTEVALLWKLGNLWEPNRSAVEQGSTVLDEYLAKTFRTRIDEQFYRVLVRARD